METLKASSVGISEMMSHTQEQRDTFKNHPVPSLKNLKWVKDDMHFLNMENFKKDFNLKGSWTGGNGLAPPPARPPPVPVKTSQMLAELEANPSSSSQSSRVVEPIENTYAFLGGRSFRDLRWRVD